MMKTSSPMALAPDRAGLERVLLTPVLAALVGVLILASLSVGAAKLPVSAVMDALFGVGDEAHRVIVQDIRLPRTLLAATIGAMHGLSGAALQGLLRNPLASPSLFGAPQAAAFGAVLAIATGVGDALSFALPLSAILMAFLSAFVLVVIVGRESNLLLLILAGLALSSLAGAATALALNLAENPFAALEISFWLLGSLDDRSFRHVALAWPFMACGAWLLWARRDAFRALSLGEEAAQSLGVNVTALRPRVRLGVALGVGAAVAVSGTIGFIGLVVPHLMRPLVGHEPGRLLAPSALAGAALLLAADIAVRLIPASSSIKVGVLTALIGVPFFLYLVFRERLRLGGATA
jgi:iron complex transport system permease protein